MRTQNANNAENFTNSIQRLSAAEARIAAVDADIATAQQNQEAANAVTALIVDLPTGTITLAHGEQIDKAAEEFEKLTTPQRNLVSQANVDRLNAAVAAIAAARNPVSVQNAVTLINAVSAIETILYTHQTQIANAENAFAALSTEYKALVANQLDPKDPVEVLTIARALVDVAVAENFVLIVEDFEDKFGFCPITHEDLIDAEGDFDFVKAIALIQNLDSELLGIVGAELLAVIEGRDALNAAQLAMVNAELGIVDEVEEQAPLSFVVLNTETSDVIVEGFRQIALALVYNDTLASFALDTAGYTNALALNARVESADADREAMTGFNPAVLALIDASAQAHLDSLRTAVAPYVSRVNAANDFVAEFPALRAEFDAIFPLITDITVDGARDKVVQTRTELEEFRADHFDAAVAKFATFTQGQLDVIGTRIAWSNLTNAVSALEADIIDALQRIDGDTTTPQQRIDTEVGAINTLITALEGAYAAFNSAAPADKDARHNDAKLARQAVDQRIDLAVTNLAGHAVVRTVADIRSYVNYATRVQPIITSLDNHVSDNEILVEAQRLVGLVAAITLTTETEASYYAAIQTARTYISTNESRIPSATVTSLNNTLDNHRNTLRDHRIQPTITRLTALAGAQWDVSDATVTAVRNEVEAIDLMIASFAAGSLERTAILAHASYQNLVNRKAQLDGHDRFVQGLDELSRNIQRDIQFSSAQASRVVLSTYHMLTVFWVDILSHNGISMTVEQVQNHPTPWTLLSHLTLEQRNWRPGFERVERGLHAHYELSKINTEVLEVERNIRNLGSAGNDIGTIAEAKTALAGIEADLVNFVNQFTTDPSFRATDLGWVRSRYNFNATLHNNGIQDIINTLEGFVARVGLQYAPSLATVDASRTLTTALNGLIHNGHISPRLDVRAGTAVGIPAGTTVAGVAREVSNINIAIYNALHVASASNPNGLTEAERAIDTAVLRRLLPGITNFDAVATNIDFLANLMAEAEHLSMAINRMWNQLRAAGTTGTPEERMVAVLAYNSQAHTIAPAHYVELNRIAAEYARIINEPIIWNRQTMNEATALDWTQNGASLLNRLDDTAAERWGNNALVFPIPAANGTHPPLENTIASHFGFALLNRANWNNAFAMPLNTGGTTIVNAEAQFVIIRPLLAQARDVAFWSMARAELIAGVNPDGTGTVAPIPGPGPAQITGRISAIQLAFTPARQAAFDAELINAIAFGGTRAVNNNPTATAPVLGTGITGAAGEFGAAENALTALGALLNPLITAGSHTTSHNLILDFQTQNFVAYFNSRRGETPAITADTSRNSGNTLTVRTEFERLATLIEDALQAREEAADAAAEAMRQHIRDLIEEGFDEVPANPPSQPNVIPAIPSLKDLEDALDDLIDSIMKDFNSHTEADLIPLRNMHAAISAELNRVRAIVTSWNTPASPAFDPFLHQTFIALEYRTIDPVVTYNDVLFGNGDLSIQNRLEYINTYISLPTSPMGSLTQSFRRAEAVRALVVALLELEEDFDTTRAFVLEHEEEIITAFMLYWSYDVRAEISARPYTAATNTTLALRERDGVDAVTTALDATAAQIFRNFALDVPPTASHFYNELFRMALALDFYLDEVAEEERIAAENARNAALVIELIYDIVRTLANPLGNHIIDPFTFVAHPETGVLNPPAGNTTHIQRDTLATGAYGTQAFWTDAITRVLSGFTGNHILQQGHFIWIGTPVLNSNNEIQIIGGTVVGRTLQSDIGVWRRILNAREAFNALSEGAQEAIADTRHPSRWDSVNEAPIVPGNPDGAVISDFNPDILGILEAAEAQFRFHSEMFRRALPVIEMIDRLPEPGSAVPGDRDRIWAANDAFWALPGAARIFVYNYWKLVLLLEEVDNAQAQENLIGTVMGLINRHIIDTARITQFGTPAQTIDSRTLLPLNRPLNPNEIYVPAAGSNRRMANRTPLDGEDITMFRHIWGLYTSLSPDRRARVANRNYLYEIADLAAEASDLADLIQVRTLFSFLLIPELGVANDNRGNLDSISATTPPLPPSFNNTNLANAIAATPATNKIEIYAGWQNTEPAFVVTIVPGMGAIERAILARMAWNALNDGARTLNALDLAFGQPIVGGPIDLVVLATIETQIVLREYEDIIRNRPELAVPPAQFDRLTDATANADYDDDREEFETAVAALQVWLNQELAFRQNAPRISTDTRNDFISDEFITDTDFNAALALLAQVQITKTLAHEIAIIEARASMIDYDSAELLSDVQGLFDTILGTNGTNGLINITGIATAQEDVLKVLLGEAINRMIDHLIWNIGSAVAAVEEAIEFLTDKILTLPIQDAAEVEWHRVAGLIQDAFDNIVGFEGRPATPGPEEKLDYRLAAQFYFLPNFIVNPGTATPANAWNPVAMVADGDGDFLPGNFADTMRLVVEFTRDIRIARNLVAQFANINDALPAGSNFIVTDRELFVIERAEQMTRLWFGTNEAGLVVSNTGSVNTVADWTIALTMFSHNGTNTDYLRGAGTHLDLRRGALAPATPVANIFPHDQAGSLWGDTVNRMVLSAGWLHNAGRTNEAIATFDFILDTLLANGTIAQQGEFLANGVFAVRNEPITVAGIYEDGVWDCAHTGDGDQDVCPDCLDPSCEYTPSTILRDHRVTRNVAAAPRELYNTVLDTTNLRNWVNANFIDADGLAMLIDGFVLRLVEMAFITTSLNDFSHIMAEIDRILELTEGLLEYIGIVPGMLSITPFSTSVQTPAQARRIDLLIRAEEIRTNQLLFSNGFNFTLAEIEAHIDHLNSVMAEDLAQVGIGYDDWTDEQKARMHNLVVATLDRSLDKFFHILNNEQNPDRFEDALTWFVGDRNFDIFSKEVGAQTATNQGVWRLFYGYESDATIFTQPLRSTPPVLADDVRLSATVLGDGTTLNPIRDSIRTDRGGVYAGTVAQFNTQFNNKYNTIISILDSFHDVQTVIQIVRDIAGNPGGDDTGTAPFTHLTHDNVEMTLNITAEHHFAIHRARVAIEQQRILDRQNETLTGFSSRIQLLTERGIILRMEIAELALQVYYADVIASLLVAEQIGAIPSVFRITTVDRANIEAARARYEDLLNTEQAPGFARTLTPLDEAFILVLPSELAMHPQIDANPLVTITVAPRHITSLFDCEEDQADVIDGLRARAQQKVVAGVWVFNPLNRTISTQTLVAAELALQSASDYEVLRPILGMLRVFGNTVVFDGLCDADKQVLLADILREYDLLQLGKTPDPAREGGLVPESAQEDRAANYIRRRAIITAQFGGGIIDDVRTQFHTLANVAARFTTAWAAFVGTTVGTGPAAVSILDGHINGTPIYELVLAGEMTGENLQAFVAVTNARLNALATIEKFISDNFILPGTMLTAGHIAQIEWVRQLTIVWFEGTTTAPVSAAYLLERAVYLNALIESAFIGLDTSAQDELVLLHFDTVNILTLVAFAHLAAGNFAGVIEFVEFVTDELDPDLADLLTRDFIHENTVDLVEAIIDLTIAVTGIENAIRAFDLLDGTPAEVAALEAVITTIIETYVLAIDDLIEYIYDETGVEFDFVEIIESLIGAQYLQILLAARAV
jgi:hypothetical protein